MRRHHNRVLLVVLLALLGATSPQARSTGNSSIKHARKLAADKKGGGGGGGGGGNKRHHPNDADDDAPNPTTYSPSQTFTISKRATVSLADYQRDPNDGPWRPDDLELASARRGDKATGRRRGEAEGESENGRRRNSSNTSPSDAELLASIPPSVREAALRQQQADVLEEEEEEQNTTTDDDAKSNDALPAHPPHEKKPGPSPKPKRVRAFDAIDAFEATFALDSGGGTSYEPPDSAVAVGNGFVGVAVNSVVEFYRARDGRPLSAPIPARDLLAVDYPEEDPYLLDPSLSYDPEVGRWFYTVARLDTNDEGSLTGGSALEVAVSASADPFEGEWSVYSFSGTNTGEDGTLTVPACVEAGSCISDYGQMRVSGDGLWLGVNVVQFLQEEEEGGGDEGDFVGASIYAMSKWALAEGLDELAVAQWYLDSLPQDDGEPAYTVMPAVAADPWSVDGAGGGAVANKQSGKKTKTNTNNANTNANAHFMSTPYTRSREYLIHYLLTGARALHDAEVSADTLQSDLSLRVSRVPVPNPWPLLPFAGRDVWQPQRGNFPLGQSMDEPAPGQIGGPDTKIMGLALAQGRLVAVYQVLKPQKVALSPEERKRQNPNAPPTLFTAVAWAQVDVGGGGAGKGDKGGAKDGGKGSATSSSSSSFSPKTEAFGTIDAKAADVIYPNVALAASGKGGIGAVLSGKTTKPSAAVAPFSLAKGPGKLRVSGPGKGLQDGGSQYTERPRFGDYSGAAVEFGLWVDGEGGGGGGDDGDDDDAKPPSLSAVWFSSEYIAQSCTLAEFEGDEGADDDDDDAAFCPVNTCRCTRAERANYATRVTRLDMGE